MKVKHLFMIMLLCATSVISLSSCSGESKWVEHWKVYIVGQYGAYAGANYRKDYLQKRFDSMAPNPDEYQKAYYSIAESATSNIDEIHDDDEMLNKVMSVVNSYMSNDRYYYDISEKVCLNLKSHPDLYVENACKIIGSVDDLKEEMASHVEAKEVEEVNVANYECYNVLYSIDEKYYVICSITDKGNGRSEIQVVDKDNSINGILDSWELLHIKTNKK